MNPPLIQPSPICGFSVNSDDAIAVEDQPAEAGRRPHRGDRRDPPVLTVEGDELVEVDVGDAVAVGEHERSAPEPAASSRLTRPPVIVSGPVSTRWTVQSSQSAPVTHRSCLRPVSSVMLPRE